MFAFLKRYNPADVLLLLTLITLPLPEHWNSKVLLITMLFLLIRFYKEFKISFPKIGWVYLLIFLFSSISYFWSAEKPETIIAIFRLMPFLLFVVGYKQFFSFQSIDKILRLTALTFVFYGLIWLILGYFRFAQTQNSATFFHHELTAPFNASAIYIALIFGQLYIFLLYNILFKKNKTKTLDIFLAVLIFGLQFLLSSKMILSILILITILFFIKYLQTSQLNRRIITVGIILSLSIAILLGISSMTKNRFKDILDYSQIENVFEKEYFGPGYYWNGLTLRLFQLRCFYEIENQPDFNNILGTGFKASQPILNQKYAYYDLYRGPFGEGENDGYFIYNFHNQYAQLLIELGIFGGILILLMLYFFVLDPLRNRNILLFSVGLLFILFALTESFFLRQKGIVSFVLFPLLASYYTINESNNNISL